MHVFPTADENARRYCVIESLRCIKKAGIKISIVTSKNNERTLEIVTRIPPNIQFDIVITPEDISPDRGKPCPETLLLACIKTNVDPRNTIFIGDMEVNRETAYRSGVHFVFLVGDIRRIEC